MKMRNKGKVYPSSSSTYSPPPAGYPPLSVLNLLPATILGLVVVLSLEDREVLAYMITRSIKSTNPPSSSTLDSKKKSSNTHKPPLFDCDCFDCYTSYWFKWDSSPNRELIHQAIEAFEESLSNGEKSKKKGKKRDKMDNRRLTKKSCESPPELLGVQVSSECNVPPVEEKSQESLGHQNPVLSSAEEVASAEAESESEAEAEATVAVMMRAAASQHKGLARKVLPDVIGLLNWRLWNFWGPNV